MGGDCAPWRMQHQIDGTLSWSGGALLHSKNNAVFIKHFKPWAEVDSLRTSSFEHRVFCNLYLTKSFAAWKAYVKFGPSTSQ